MMRIRSLVLKIVTSMILIDIVSMSIVTLFYYLQSKDALYNRAFIQLSQVKKNKADQLNSFFKNAEFALNSVAANYKASTEQNINEMLPFSRLYIYYKNYDSLTPYLKPNNYDIDQWMLSKQLSVYKEIPSIFETINYQLSRNHIYISQIIDSSSYLIAEINSLELDNILAHDYSDSLIDKSIESYLVADDGYLRTSSIFIPDAKMKSRYSENSMKEFKQSLNNSTSVNYDYRGITVLRTSNRLQIGDLNWTILVEIDEQEVNAPFTIMWRNTLFVILLINIGISFLAYFFAVKITTPIINLTNASKTMYDGNYPDMLPIISNDEIGILTNNFNEMIDKIHNQAIELEQERKDRLNAYILATELERKRLSSELHDGLGQSLIALKLQLECLDTDNISSNNKILNESKNLLNDTINELRNMSNDLLPNVLSELGLLEAIKQVISYCSNIQNLNIELDNQVINDFEINEKDSVHIYRIIQESIKNAISHSLATNIKIILKEADEEYTFIVRDNGIGFEYTDKTIYGNGLYNINERAGLINANIEIKSTKDTGTEIKIVKRKI